ncbi:hypothetical protein PF010_g25244 [Phytophthora fragariae]|uniref:Uncharacterized protein n=1 Tax=Phytophthora fragariae TaxID=53985 RepID=A0A6G0MKP4_9STRA|nr:hypothetical protein PF010_g25244 [Phytophthora fragariae]KAE9172064.1 hypothetical protein PF004_g27379 [Phytophthora fragariae]
MARRHQWPSGHIPRQFVRSVGAAPLLSGVPCVTRSLGTPKPSAAPPHASFATSTIAALAQRSEIHAGVLPRYCCGPL